MPRSQVGVRTSWHRDEVVRRWGRGALICLTTLCATSACRTDITGPTIHKPDVRAWVTGVAAQSLDAFGHFVFPAKVPSSPYASIQSSRASELAVAYMRTFGATAAFVQTLEVQHGGPVFIDSLRVDPRVEFADSPYEPVPSDYPAFLRRTLAPRYIVRLLTVTTPTVSVSVSAYATELNIQQGIIVFPTSSGGEFQAFGNALTQGFEDPITPERATEIVSRSSGALVSDLPVLVAPDWRYSVGYCKWQLTLDRAVTVRSATSVLVTRTVYVGLVIDPTTGKNSGAIFVPSSTQPQVDSIRTASAQYLLQLRPDIPVAFDQVLFTK